MEIAIIGIIATAVALLGIALCLGIIIMTLMQSRLNREAIRNVEEKFDATIAPAKVLAAAEAATTAAAAAQRVAEQNERNSSK